MPDRLRAVLLAALTLVIGLAIVAPPPAARAATQKVAIIVGPVGSLTTYYRTWADEVAAVAQASGATIAKAYSPSATWPAVREAVNGANVIVYFGHGSGFPNPYGATELTDRANGWGLNTATTNGDADSWSAGTLVYCGEKALLGTLTSSDGAAQRQYCGGADDTDGISPAPNFTMVYAQAHYAPGFGERYVPETPATTLGEARQRVSNYSTPILRLGGTFLATAYGDADDIVRRVLTGQNRAFADIFADGRGWSPSTASAVAHADVSGAQVWVQRTVISGFHFGEPDYWYAFAGNPAKTPGGGTAVPVTATPPTVPPTPPPSATTDIQRLAGSDRYATAAAVSAASFPAGVPVAYVATGSDFPDALAAGAAAARQGGPLLLVASGSIPASTANELSRLRPSVIRVVGGPAIIGDAVVAGLRPYATSGRVERIAGPNRYATAAQISGATFAPGVEVAVIAVGSTFPDALSGVAVAGRSSGPVLLTQATALPPETAAELGRLRPQRILVLGGAGVVSDSVVAAIRPYATSGTVQRLGGSDRYATAVEVARSSFPAGSTVFVATGLNFPDALGGGPVAGSVPGPLLLVPGSSIPSSVAAELQRLAPTRVVVLGGASVVGDGVVSQIASLLGG